MRDTSRARATGPDAPPTTGPPPGPPARRIPVRIPPQALIGYGLLLGLAMIVIAWGWRLISGGNVAWFPLRGWLSDLAIGTLLGTAFAFMAWVLLDRVPALKRIELLLVHTLDMDKLRYHHAFQIGLVAGIPEEILFRGALQPSLGLLLTSVIFGALHGITRGYFVYAAVAGLLLGALVEWRGGLWAAIAAHTMVDAVVFALLIRSWRRRTQSSPPSSPP